MKKAIVLVLDGFGIGAMDDVSEVRPQDIGSNTALHIFNTVDVALPTLEKLGLMNALGCETKNMKFSKDAVYGTSNLAHYGGDTFFGHQEIMTSVPKKPLKMPFNQVIDKVELALINASYTPKRTNKDGVSLLSINDEIFIGDNLETDLGMVYNVTTSFDFVDFYEARKVAKIVRENVHVARVIVFGGIHVSKLDLLNAIETKNNMYIGVNAPKSKVYIEGYKVEHLGYGVDSEQQIQTKLFQERNISTAFIGKVADICNNDHGDSYSIVPTKEVMEKLLETIKENRHGFICANVQETDLAGHSENSQMYAEKLSIVDAYLEQVLPILTKDDLLIIMADHGNDPTIGHSKHTRERVPLLIYKKGLKNVHLGNRSTLADVGATVGAFWDVKEILFGTPFWNNLKI